MFDQIPFGGEFFEALLQEDERIVREVAARGCPACEGRLHRADYARKPRGALVAVEDGKPLVAVEDEKYATRFSLCCDREGCRRRAMPPSLRFLGRRVYLGAVVLVASLFARMTMNRAEVRRRTGVPTRTTCRWLGWWAGPFVSTEVFLALRARLIGVAVDALPGSILLELPGTLPEKVRAVLALLTPLTRGQGARRTTRSEGCALGAA
jgi:hypothetical protein